MYDELWHTCRTGSRAALALHARQELEQWKQVRGTLMEQHWQKLQQLIRNPSCTPEATVEYAGSPSRVSTAASQPPGHSAPRQQGRAQPQQPSIPVDVKDVDDSASTNNGRANNGQKVLPSAQSRKARDKMMAELLRPRQQTHRCT